MLKAVACRSSIVQVTISANGNNLNIATLAGNPAAATVVNVVIIAGVTIGASAGGYALQSGTLPAGSSIYLVNNGSIQGRGGAGGGGNGSFGSGAIDTSVPINIDNSNGYILGGGGGGGAGRTYNPGGLAGAGGGGGGGGRGNPGGAGGAKSAQSGGIDGTDGSAGSTSAYGAKGNGAINSFYGTYGGNGGRGGGWGENGSDGSPNHLGQAGSSGGTAGKAVNLNGNAVTWTGGNNSTQVKGSVS